MEALSRGDAADGYERLKAMGAVREIADDDQRYKRLAQDYLALTSRKKRLGFARKPKSALIVSPTHKEGDIVTEAVREKLRDAKRIGANDRGVLRLRSTAWTQAERSYAGLYEEGHVIQFIRRAAGFKAGDRLTVTGHDEGGHVMAVDAKGRTVTVPLDRAARFEVYRTGTIHLATGDLIRITKKRI